MYREDSEFKKDIEALTELLKRERDINRVTTIEELDAKKKAINLVSSWIRDIFSVELKVDEPDSGLEDLFIYREDK